MKIINFLLSRFFRLIPIESLLINSYKTFTISEKLDLRIPYTNIESIEFLKNHTESNPDLKVFEYGSGSSTLFFEDNCKEVHSVEYDEEWYKFIKKYSNKANIYFVKPEISKNPKIKSKKYFYRKFDFYEYVNFIKTFDEKFDIIFIDGRARAECLKVAKEHINPGGIIIFDDSHRLRYKKILKVELKNKFVLNLKGLTTFLPSITRVSFIK
mgnify:CR=1 FL=1